MARISNTSAYPNLVTPVTTDYLILTDESDNLMTKSCTLGDVQGLFGVDTLVAHVTVASASLLTLPATDVTLIAAPGTNKVLDIISMDLYVDAGNIAYNFNAISPIGTSTGDQLSAVPFKSCKLSLLNLPVIVCDPAFICANSMIPSSVPLLASKILPVILA